MTPNKSDDAFWTGQRTNKPELTDWGHQYGSSANGSYVGEDLGGIDDASQLSVRWLGRPGADFGIDRNPRMPAPLVVGGRLFHQGMNRMIALDAFNGSVLWSLEIPDLRRAPAGPEDTIRTFADDEDAAMVGVISGGEKRDHVVHRGRAVSSIVASRRSTRWAIALRARRCRCH